MFQFKEREGTKRCSRCFQEQPYAQFYRDRTRGDGYTYICRTCILERQGIEVSREDSVVRRPRLHDKWRQVCARPSCRETVGKEGELFCYRHRRNKDEWAKQKARRDAERLANPPPPRPQPKARSENVPRSPLLSIAPPDQKYVSTSNKSRFSRTRQLQVIQKPPPCPGREDGYHMMDVWLTDDGIQIQQCRCCPHHREHDYREVTF